MEGLTGHAVKHFTALQWTSLTAGQLQCMSPHTASFISIKDLASIENISTDKQMHEIRIALRGKAVVLMGKSTMMRKAIRGQLEKNPDTEMLLPHIKTNASCSSCPPFSTSPERHK